MVHRNPSRDVMGIVPLATGIRCQRTTDGGSRIPSSDNQQVKLHPLSSFLGFVAF